VFAMARHHISDAGTAATVSAEICQLPLRLAGKRAQLTDDNRPATSTRKIAQVTTALTCGSIKKHRPRSREGVVRFLGERAINKPALDREVRGYASRVPSV